MKAQNIESLVPPIFPFRCAIMNSLHPKKMCSQFKLLFLVFSHYCNGQLWNAYRASRSVNHNTTQFATKKVVRKQNRPMKGNRI